MQLQYGRTTLSKFIIEEQRQSAERDEQLTALINDIQTGCKYIAAAIARGPLQGAHGSNATRNVQGETQQKLDVASNDIMLRSCEWGGQLAGMVSEELPEPYVIPSEYPRGRYLLAFDPLDGSSNIDVNVTVGSVFSILRAPRGPEPAAAADFLQPGTEQVCAGYALYGPAAMLVLTLGRGVHGFTLDPEIGAYILTHPNMRVPEDTREFAVNSSNERFWERPVQRYVSECVRGQAGIRGADFNMRWIASLVAEVHRILVRGGLFMYPRDNKDPKLAGRLRLLYEANPMAMIIEQAGGRATTGRERILGIRPDSLHQRVPLILGSRNEVERLERYHREFDAGTDEAYASPLFNTKSLLTGDFGFGNRS
jgi:fructose-1,6-bisphosphatase